MGAVVDLVWSPAQGCSPLRGSSWVSGSLYPTRDSAEVTLFLGLKLPLLQRSPSMWDCCPLHTPAEEQAEKRASFFSAKRCMYVPHQSRG